MERRWKAVPAGDNSEVYVAETTPADRTPIGSPKGPAASSGPRPDFPGTTGGARGSKTEEEAQNLYEEWVRGDLNHTAALVLLGLALLTAGFWTQISAFLAALFAPSWAKFCTLFALACFGAAIYPWLRPVHGHVKERRRGLKAQLEKVAGQAGKMAGLPDMMASMNTQMDVMIKELVTVRKHMESMRDKTDWLPSKNEDKDESKPPKPSTGLLNKLF